MPEILDEDVLTTAAACRELNRRVPDARFSPVGIWRWMTQGVIAAGGQRVCLEHARLGRKLVTSKQALARFAHRLAERAPAAPRDSPSAVDAKADLLSAGFFK